MTTLPNRPNTALLIIDVQNGVVKDAYNRDAVVANIGSLVDRAREENVPVVWVQHADEELVPGTESWQYVPELVRHDSEPLVQKHYGDSFEGTELEYLLTAAQVGRLVVVGAQTDACIRSTIHGGFARGYDVTLVRDAHTTDQYDAAGYPSAELIIAHTNSYWRYEDAPGRTAAVVTTEDLEFGQPSQRATT